MYLHVYEFTDFTFLKFEVNMKIIFYVHYIYVNLPYNEMSVRDTE